MDENVRPDDMERITTPELATGVHRRAGGRHPRAGGRQEGAAGAVRRRGLLGGGGAAHQGHRQAARLRAREPRPHAQGRERAGGRRVPEPDGREPGVRGRHRPLPAICWPAWTSPRPSARSSAPSSSACSRRRPARWATRWSFLAQGTIYPDILESTDGVKAHHNVGGLPDDLQFELVRAREAAVQGRGARRRPRAGAAREHGRAPALPRPGPGRALPGRHHARPPGGAARGRRHPARGVRRGRPRGQGVAVLR